MLAAFAILVAGCATEPADTTVNPAVVLAPADLPKLDPIRVERGAEMYGAFCATCHGIDLAGSPDWKVPNPDGSFKPPPQDSRGHTWHHSDQVLIDLIANGSDFAQSRMPTFGDVLSESDILTILEYLKSNWGEQERASQWAATSQQR
ncbi:MAG: cytochrome c [Acidimicrobiia bacterium]|nr:cytochrome c [Acidimicrobiia bacterium]